MLRDKMSSCQEIVLVAREENIPIAIKFIEKIMTSAGFASTKIMKVSLAVEEACRNIVNHAYPNEKGCFRLSCSSIGYSLVVVIEDEGIHFDPTQVNSPLLVENVEERPIGGLGIHLIKSFVYELKYEFVDGKNALTLVMKKD